MFSVAYAAGPAGGSDMMVIMQQMMPLILIFAVFYFLLIMPQQRKAKEHKAMLDAVQKGDDVVTNGGIHAKVVGVTDQVLTLDVGEKVKIKVSRDAIAYKKSEASDKKK